MISDHSTEALAESQTDGGGFLHDAATCRPPCGRTTFRVVVPHGLTVANEAAAQAEPVQAQRGLQLRVGHDPHQLSALNDLRGNQEKLRNFRMVCRSTVPF